MSERGTFVTSFLYDERLVPVLRAALTRCARPGSLADIWPPSKDTLFPTCAFAGVMHGGFGGEESIVDMPAVIEDEILPHLPPEHGQFSIVVMPEDDSYTRLFVISKGVCTATWINTEEGRKMTAVDHEIANPTPPVVRNISDIARAEKGLTPKSE